MAVDDHSEVSSSILKGCCRGNQFLLVLSTELIFVTQVAQRGGLTFVFALHLVFED